ncbi:cupin domain-containing protein [Variovorax sp. J22P240]|uniref:cupin domain-containing protein n=1 Tax=Variovorax sp. J22P240 TaxID=3053514 RepID=UPI002575B2D2|nr:cupin domain-containing protein [Variovorax sp. J22P240]MDM0001118.1 cupin domain-containing protein [Variovorax sp. J22P240]
MALKHARLLEVIDLHASDEERGTSVSSSLLKTDHLQLMQVVLPAGAGLPEHQVAGEITIQCLVGEAKVVTPRRTCQLAVGQLVALPGGEPHAVQAIRDATLLVTVLRDR